MLAGTCMMLIILRSSGSLRYCKPTAYYSSHNVHKYCLVVNSLTVDYSAFWCNGFSGWQSGNSFEEYYGMRLGGIW
jgi:hypothetical protein